MKISKLLISFQVFGLITHLLLVLSLISIGFFDFLGLKPLINSIAELLNSLSATQPDDQLSNLITAKMVEIIPVLLSSIKGLSIMAILSLVAHSLSFYKSWDRE